MKDGYGARYYMPQIPSYTLPANWDSEKKRTYEQLNKYFKAPNYLDEKGYYSTFYELTYYDGYGYNFYTGAKGYYEYSRPP